MRSRVREALFSMLGDSVPGGDFLDVFAGSGALAIEALSRGARHALLIENEPEVISVLKRNLAALALTRRVRVLAIDPYTTLPEPGSSFRHIFLDPPFADFDHRSRDPWTLAQKLSDALLERGGFLGLEFPSRLEPPDPPASHQLKACRRYGDTKLILWQKKLESRRGTEGSGAGNPGLAPGRDSRDI